MQGHLIQESELLIEAARSSGVSQMRLTGDGHSGHGRSVPGTAAGRLCAQGAGFESKAAGGGGASGCVGGGGGGGMGTCLGSGWAACCCWRRCSKGCSASSGGCAAAFAFGFLCFTCTARSRLSACFDMICSGNLFETQLLEPTPKAKLHQRSAELGAPNMNDEMA